MVVSFRTLGTASRVSERISGMKVTMKAITHSVHIHYHSGIKSQKCLGPNSIRSSSVSAPSW